MEEQTRKLKEVISTHMINHITGFHIIAGFKSQFRSAFMKREHQHQN
jgi:hypothetical protein